MGFFGTQRRHPLLALTCVFAAMWCAPLHAEWSASLPLFHACTPAAAPQLPERWRAVGLMMPFVQDQLDVGEFVYDRALPAMRATVYGVESGAVDLLITDSDTYVLSGPHNAPTGCTSLGARLRPPSPQWLASDSTCVGQETLATREVQRWKKLGFDAARYWFSADTRLPWRTLFLSRALDPAIVGDYAMTYFATFTPLPATNLAALRDLCAAKAKPLGGDQEFSATPTARELMALASKAAETERPKRLRELIPGLSHQACSKVTPVRWPDKFVTTAMVTPIAINQLAYSTLIYYDWSDSGTQLVMPFHGYPPELTGLIWLKNHVGYRYRHWSKTSAGKCEAAFPGIVRPDWMTVDSCQCRGVISGNAAFSPLGVSQILSCPIKMQGRRVMWNWYTADGRPIMFTEAAPEDSGGGVMLADYQDWIPGHTAPADNFNLPDTCVAPSETAAGSAAPSFANPSCSGCHTTAFGGQQD